MDRTARSANRWRRVPGKAIRAAAARLLGRCRVYWIDWPGGSTTFLWSQPHGDECYVIGWRSYFAVAEGRRAG